MTVRRTSFIYHDILTKHLLSQTHPLKPLRLRYTYELLEAYKAFTIPNATLVKPRQATEEEILSYHTSIYLNGLRSLSSGMSLVDQEKFNLGSGDNPVYRGMYEAAAWSAGASLKGAELLSTNETDVAFNISGGLHHAMPGHASGFCVFNDPVIAIYALLQHGLRIAYVDIDCHHGDGVQSAFYDTDKVLTISIHESGEFLFPGTGFTQETGTGNGQGYSVNVPLYPYTTDDVYLWAFSQVVPPILESFRPDVLVTQLGVDSHYLDPITHLALTVQGFCEVVKQFSQFSPKWLALGGGGYELHTVARAWSMAYGIMSGQHFTNPLPSSYQSRYGISTLSDSKEPLLSKQQRINARKYAENSVMEVQRFIFPAHGLHQT